MGQGFPTVFLGILATTPLESLTLSRRNEINLEPWNETNVWNRNAGRHDEHKSFNSAFSGGQLGNTNNELRGFGVAETRRAPAQWL